MLKPASVIVLAGLAAGLGACSETAFMDTLGIGKNVPDERLVATNPPLSVPPDLRLPPPGQGTAATDSAQAAARNGDLATPPADATAAAYASARPAAPATQTAARAAPGTTTSPGATKGPDDIFARYGISRYHPDGREKTIAELNRELAEKIKEEKRRKNPNYGTIFNIGELFR
jgi:hypothetical protein